MFEFVNMLHIYISMSVFIIQTIIFEPALEKTNNVAFNKSDTSRAVQPQKTDSSFKFQI